MSGLAPFLAVGAAIDKPLLLWSEPGQGKTAATRQFCAVTERHCETVIASLRDPTDFGGLPVVIDGAVHLAPPNWARRAHAAALAGQDVLLFFDEFTTAPPAVQAALLRVVDERVVGDLDLRRLPAGAGRVYVLAAANPEDQAAGGWGLSAPLANRLIHVTWRPELADWLDGMVSGWAPQPPVRVRPDWAAGLPAARTLVAAYIKTQPTKRHVLPEDEARRGGPWPSLRTWEYAAYVIAAAGALELPADRARAVRNELLAGTVGDVAAEFARWEQELDLPDPEALLADPGALVLPRRTDLQYAILTAVTGAVIGSPATNTPARWEACCEVLAKAEEAGNPDIAAVCLGQLARNRPTGARTPRALERFAQAIAAARIPF